MLSFEELKQKLKNIGPLSQDECFELEKELIEFNKTATDEQRHWLLYCGYCEGLLMACGGSSALRKKGIIE